MVFVPIMDGRFDKKVRRKYNEAKISFPNNRLMDRSGSKEYLNET
jgi:hypothetical protein